MTALLLKIIIAILILAGVIYIVGAFIFFLEPYSLPQNLTLSNVTDHQLTVSWVTDKPTRGAIIVSKNNHFPLLPFFTKSKILDDGEKLINKTGFYTTHHVSADNLDPDSKYYFRVYQGLRVVAEGTVITSSTLSSLIAPNPVYGKVQTSQKTPAVGAIVYLTVQNGATASAALSTLSNSQGGWSLDLANLRSKDFKSGFKIASRSAEIVVVEGGHLGKFKAVTKPGKDKPWSDIILSSK